MKKRFVAFMFLITLMNFSISYAVEGIERGNDKKNIFFGLIIIALYSLFHTFTTKIRINLRYKFYKSPIKYKEYKEIPMELDPIFVTTLISCKNNKNISDKKSTLALLFYMAKKNLIELTRKDTSDGWHAGNVIISTKMGENLKDTDNIEDLSDVEKFYYNLILKYSKGNPITLGQVGAKLRREYGKGDLLTSKIEELVGETGKKRGIFQTKHYTKIVDKLKRKSDLYKKIGIFMLVIANIFLLGSSGDVIYEELIMGVFFFLGIAFIINYNYLKSISNKFILLTQLGETEYAKWNGLYNYLNSEKFFKEPGEIDIETWEQYLIYGTAFGLFENVRKVLKFKGIEIEKSAFLSNICVFSEKKIDDVPKDTLSENLVASAKHIKESFERIDWEEFDKRYRLINFFFGSSSNNVDIGSCDSDFDDWYD